MKTFEEAITLMIKHTKRLRKLYELKVDLVDAFEEYDQVINLLWENILTEYGMDWLSWYLYEKDGISGKPRKDIQAWDEGGKEICKNLKNLHSFLVENSYFRTLK